MKYRITTMKFLILLMVMSSTDILGQTSLFFAATTGYPDHYTFDSGDIMYYRQGRNTSTSATCEGSTGVVRSYRVQESVFILELKSTSMDSIKIYGKSNSTNDRAISFIEVADEKDGSYTDITSTANITNSMRYGNCGTLCAGNLGIAKNKFVRITITLPDDAATLAPVNICELYIESGDATGIGDVEFNIPVKHIRYYSLMGNEIEESTKGFVIKKVLYENGEVRSYKLFEK